MSSESQVSVSMMPSGFVDSTRTSVFLPLVDVQYKKVFL